MALNNMVIIGGLEPRTSSERVSCALGCARSLGRRNEVSRQVRRGLLAAGSLLSQVPSQRKLVIAEQNDNERGQGRDNVQVMMLDVLRVIWKILSIVETSHKRMYKGGDSSPQ